MTVSVQEARTPPRPDSARAFMRALMGALPRKALLALGLMLIVSVTEWAGLLLLIPLLAAVGLDVGQGAVGAISTHITSAFAAVGLVPSLPAVLVVYIAIVTARALLTRRQTLAMVDLDKDFVLYMRQRLYRAVAYARWPYFSRMRSSEFLHALTGQIGRIGTATGTLLAMIAGVLVGLVYLLVAVALSPTMTALAASSGLVLLFVLRSGNQRARQAGERLNRVTGRLLAAVTEHLGGMKTVKSYAAEDRNIAIFTELTNEVADTHRYTSRNYATIRVGFDVGAVIILSLALYVSLEVLALSTAEIVLLLFLFARLVPRFSSVQHQYQSFVNALPAFTSVTRLLETCESEAEARTTGGGGAAFTQLREGVVLRGVSFRYAAGEESLTVADVDLTIRASRTTAIVGPSGAGKSTVADLVMGLLVPESGRVLIDGRPLGPDRIRSWREAIGYVPQDTFLLHDSVRANLLWAAPESNESELWDALRLAAADGFIRRLPAGLDTIIGDRGVLLSGGERQRLALARALLRKPLLLILDEATSALDSENERRIQSAIDALHGRMTILVITHRLSTIRHADEIHVIDEGHIVESGRWDVLANQSGRFAALCAAQGIAITDLVSERTRARAVAL